MAPRGSGRDREPRRGRITIGRRVDRIGFMGRGMTVAARGESDVAHALSLRMEESLIAESDPERERYRYDAEPHPGILGRIFTRKPEVVVFPDSGQCVADILDVCIEEATCAVPRGSGSAGLGGAAPVRGGVVVDLSRMNRVVSLDAERRSVTVEAGCTWGRLRDEIASEMLSLRSYPSNLKSGTVGGWLSTGGYGVGTLTGGRFHTNVDSLEVAVPSGLLINADRGSGRYSIESFSGTEGQLGVITAVGFPLKVKPELVAHYAVETKGITEGLRLAQDLAALNPAPVGIRFLTGGLPAVASNESETGKGVGSELAVLFEGSEVEVRKFEGMLKSLAAGSRLEIIEGDEARCVFETQVTDSAIARKSTLVLSGEALVGLDRLVGFLEALDRASDGMILFDTQVVSPGLAVVMASYLLEGPGFPRVIRDVPATIGISQAAMDAGGRPYGFGLWNTPFAAKVLGNARKNLKAIKQETDRLNTLNPGKFFSLTMGSGLPVWSWVYGLGLRAIRVFR